MKVTQRGDEAALVKSQVIGLIPFYKTIEQTTTIPLTLKTITAANTIEIKLQADESCYTTDTTKYHARR